MFDSNNKYQSIPIIISMLIIGFVTFVIGLIFCFSMLFKYPLEVFVFAVCASLTRLIYAGVTGK